MDLQLRPTLPNGTVRWWTPSGDYMWVAADTERAKRELRKITGKPESFRPETAVLLALAGF